MKGYKITKEGVRNLNNTASAVQKLLKNGPKGSLPFRQNAPKGGGGVATLQIGKTTAAWAKGTSQEVNLYSNADRTQLFEADGVTPKTASAYNLFADIEADKWVAFISGYLVSAECDD